MNSDVAAEFQDMEPGWSCIYFSRPPKREESRLHSLLCFLEKWRAEHPTRRIVQLQIVEDRQQARALNIFWTTFEHLDVENRIEHFTIDTQVKDLYGQEYCEALMHDAAAFAADNHLPDTNVLMVSKRRIAIVIIRATSQALLCLVDSLITRLRPELSTQLALELPQWMASNRQGYYCMSLPNDFQQ